MSEKRYTPDPITELKENEIFVFGANYQGIHGAGAAKAAADFYGAKYGVGKGFTGRCYAFPTVVFPGAVHKLSTASLHEEMKDFLKCVEQNPDLTFMLTKVGCGLAGVKVEEMKEVFKAHYNPELHTNLVYPIEFE